MGGMKEETDNYRGAKSPEDAKNWLQDEKPKNSGNPEEAKWYEILGFVIADFTIYFDGFGFLDFRFSHGVFSLSSFLVLAPPAVPAT